MSFLFGFAVNDADRFACALHEHRDPLRVPAERARGGSGLGFYQGNEVLLQKRPRGERGDLDFFELARGVQSDVVVGFVHARDDGGPAAAEDTQPFRFRRWLGAMRGVVPRFEDLRHEILEQVPEYLRRNIRGRTFAEHVFHLFLARMHDARDDHGTRAIDKADVRPEVVAGQLDETLRTLDAAVSARGAAPGPFSLLATNGQVLAACRRGRPLYALRRNGIADCPVCRQQNLERGRGNRAVAHDQMRAVLIVSDAASGAPGWEEVPEGSVITVDRSFDVRVTALSPPGSAGK